MHKGKKDIDLSYITDMTYKELLDGSFKAREAVLSEGYSLVYGKFISEGLGYTNLFLFKYDLKNLNKSGRMRFYYSLYGRTESQEGVLKELNAVKFSDTVLLCPVENSEKMKEYLQSWSIEVLEFPVLMPSRLKHIL